MPNRTRTIRYENGNDEVLVAVPWDYHTGMIPPPSLTFGVRVFLYAGAGPDVTIPTGQGGGPDGE